MRCRISSKILVECEISQTFAETSRCGLIRSTETTLSGRHKHPGSDGRRVHGTSRERTRNLRTRSGGGRWGPGRWGRTPKARATTIVTALTMRIVLYAAVDKTSSSSCGEHRGSFRRSGRRDVPDMAESTRSGSRRAGAQDRPGTACPEGRSGPLDHAGDRQDPVRAGKRGHPILPIAANWTGRKRLSGRQRVAPKCQFRESQMIWPIGINQDRTVRG